jgi:glutamate dehydrogenase
VTRTEHRRGSDVRERIVDAIVASRVQSGVLKDRRQIKLFLRQYFAHVPYEDLQGRVEKIMARVALDHLEFGATRKKGQALVRFFNPTVETHGYESAFSFIEMVNDDMPFLVDSVFAAINRQGLAVHITVHPIIRIVRNSRGRIQRIAEPDKETGALQSLIRFAIDKETDAQQIKLLKQEILKVLADVRVAVRDWSRMREKMCEARDLLELGPPGVDEELRAESQKLLEWMVSDHFTFLGYREYKLSYRKDKIFLRPVEGSGLGLLSRDERGQTKTVELTSEMQRLTRSKDWLILTKANSRSTVHRHVYLDYVGIKEFDKSGKASGERRFIGLFTSAAYSESPRNIPLLRHKVKKVIERAHVPATGHRGKALLHILDTFPRDELFQCSIPDLSRMAVGILNLQDRQRVRFFLRRDTFRRFRPSFSAFPVRTFMKHSSNRCDAASTSMSEPLSWRRLNTWIQNCLPSCSLSSYGCSVCTSRPMPSRIGSASDSASGSSALKIMKCRNPGAASEGRYSSTQRSMPVISILSIVLMSLHASLGSVSAWYPAGKTLP